MISNDNYFAKFCNSVKSIKQWIECFSLNMDYWIRATNHEICLIKRYFVSVVFVFSVIEMQNRAWQ